MSSREPTEPTDETLASELVRAGRTVVIDPVPDDLVGNVLTAIGSAPAPHRRRWLAWWRWLRARRRRLVATVIAIVLLVGALTPPVRATVSEWLRIGGVLIRTGAPPSPGATSSPSSSGPTRSSEMTLDQARNIVDFPIGVPSELGPPERVTVTDDHRVVGMDWTVDGRPVHLDQFDGTISWVFLKRNWSTVTPTDVDDADGAWLADPHEIVYIDRAGTERRETARISGPSLIWQPTLDGREVTVRLEGVATLDQARTIAGSLR